MDVNLILIAGAIAAVASGALLTFKISKQKTRSGTNEVVIKDVRTRGDIAGRDINKPK